MKVLVILSHSWSPFLPVTCLYGNNELLWVSGWASGVFVTKKNSPQITHPNHMTMTTSGHIISWFISWSDYFSWWDIVVASVVCLSHSGHIKSCPSQYSETIHDSCYIFSGYINLIWKLCTVRLFCPFDLPPWNYVWPSPWKFCLGHYSETKNCNCFIISGLQPEMGPVYCRVILTFWPWSYDIWLWNLVCKLLFIPAEGYSVAMLYFYMNVLSRNLKDRPFYLGELQGWGCSPR